MGVVEVLNKRGSHGFDESDLAILGALADSISVALENALLVRGLRREKAEKEEESKNKRLRKQQKGE